MKEKKGIIVIDSDFSLIEDMRRRFLLEPTYEIVATASLATEGLGKILQFAPAYVVIANPLPDVELMRFIADLNSAYPQIKKIVTLEIENPLLSAQCMQGGANYVLVKPYSADKLIAAFALVEKSAYTQNNPSPYSQPQASLEQLRGAFNQLEQHQSGQVPPTRDNPPYSPPPIAAQNIYSENNAYAPIAPIRTEPKQQGGFRTLRQTIIAVNCPKGGVGKTTISKELAIAFAMVTVNGQRLRVLLVDCDVDFGDVTSMLKLNSYPNIIHWTSDITQRLRANPHGEIRYSQQEIEERFLITHSSSLKILAAPSNHTDALDITGKEMEIILENLKNCNYDVIILDTGNNTKDYSLIALDKAHTILMVTTLDVTTINDTNMLLNTLRSIQFPTAKIKLIVNRMPKERDIDINEITQVLRAPIIGIIPEFPKIRLLNNGGTPAVLGKESDYTTAIRKIGNAIVPVFNRQISASEAKEGKEVNSGERKGLFSRFFKK